MSAPVPSSAAAAAATFNEPDYGVCHRRLGKLVLSRYMLLTERIPMWYQTEKPSHINRPFSHFFVVFIKLPVMEEIQFYPQYFNTMGLQHSLI
jgi:hypothetical protein